MDLGETNMAAFSVSIRQNVAWCKKIHYKEFVEVFMAWTSQGGNPRVELVVTEAKGGPEIHGVNITTMGFELGVITPRVSGVSFVFQSTFGSTTT